MAVTQNILRWNGENLINLPRPASVLFEWGIKLKEGVKAEIEIADIDLESNRYCLRAFLLRGEHEQAGDEDQYLVDFAPLLLTGALNSDLPIDIQSLSRYRIEKESAPFLSFGELVDMVLRLLLDRKFSLAIRLDQQLAGSGVIFTLFSPEFTDHHLVETRVVDDRLRQFLEFD